MPLTGIKMSGTSILNSDSKLTKVAHIGSASGTIQLPNSTLKKLYLQLKFLHMAENLQTVKYPKRGEPLYYFEKKC